MTAAVLATGEYRLIPGRLRIKVHGLRHNSQYAQQIAKVLLDGQGIRTVTANPLTGKVLIHFNDKLTGLADIQRLLASVGETHFTAGPPRASLAGAVIPAKELSRAQAMYTLTTGGVLAGLVLKRGLVGASPLAASAGMVNLAAIATIISGYPILRAGFEAYARKNKINHDLILFTVTLALLTMRESLLGLSVLWLVHLTHLFRSTLQVRSAEQIENLLIPKQQQTWLATGRQVNAGELKAGDIIVIHPDEIIPVDGQVIDGQATITQIAIAGDSQPQLKAGGDMVFAGSQVQTGLLTIKAVKVGNATSVARIAGLAQELQNRKLNKPPSAQGAGRLMGWALALSGSVLLLTYNWTRSLAVLLAGCPAALSLSRSTALGAAAVAAAEQGTYVKDNTILEQMGTIDTVLFDKTGTLTTALPELAELIALTPDYSENEVLAFAAAAETAIQHPLARLLQSEAQQRNIPLPAAGADGQLLIGYGVRTRLDRKTVIVGNRMLMKREKVALTPAKTRSTHLEQAGRSLVYVAVDRRLIGLIGIKDRLKPESHAAIDRLRTLGIRDIRLVTGDTAAAAAPAATALGLASHWPSLLPAQKAQQIEALRRAGKQVAMVGDGTNDAPAFAVSNAGLVMGMTGTPQAIQAADIILANDDPRSIACTIDLGRRTNRIIRQNAGLAGSTNILGMALAATGLVSPLLAGILLNLSTLAVLGNAARLLPRKKRP